MYSTAMSHDWPCRCKRCRQDEAVDLALEGSYTHPWKQDQDEIDRERDAAVYEQWEPGDHESS